MVLFFLFPSSPLPLHLFRLSDGPTVGFRCFCFLYTKHTKKQKKSSSHFQVVSVKSNRHPVMRQTLQLFTQQKTICVAAFRLLECFLLFFSLDTPGKFGGKDMERILH